MSVAADSGRLTSRRRIGFDIGRLFSGEMANKVLRFAATVVLARVLSPSQFGLVNVGVSISGIVMIACSLGLADLGAREVAVNPSQAGWLLGHITTVRLAAVTLLSALGLLVAAFTWTGHTILLAAAAAMAIFMSVSGDWLGRGLGRMTLVASAVAMGGVGLIVGSVAVVVFHGGANGAMASFALGEAATLAVLWVGLHRRLQVSFGLAGTGALLRRARPLALSALAIYSYYANLDTIILAASRSEAAAGLYSAPYRLFLMFNVVGIFAAYAMLPVLSRLVEADALEQALHLVRSIVGLLAIYGLVVLGLVEVVGSDLLALFFGSRFRAAEATFILLVSGVSWYVTGYPAGYSLIADGRNAGFLRGAAAAGLINVGLDFALIPLMGMRGAGLATIVAFMVSAIVWLRERSVLARATIPMCGALTAASVLALLVAFLGLNARVGGALTLGLAGALAANRFYAARASVGG